MLINISLDQQPQSFSSLYSLTTELNQNFILFFVVFIAFLHRMLTFFFTYFITRHYSFQRFAENSQPKEWCICKLIAHLLWDTWIVKKNCHQCTAEQNYCSHSQTYSRGKNFFKIRYLILPDQLGFMIPTESAPQATRPLNKYKFYWEKFQIAEGVWTGSICLRIRRGGGHLYMR